MCSPLFQHKECSFARELLMRIQDDRAALKRQRPYAGGGHPFIEERLSAEWQKAKRLKGPLSESGTE
jgi:hypothetical protein